MTNFKIIRNTTVVVVVCVLLFSLAKVTAMERVSLSPIEQGVKNIVAPLQGGATSTVQKVKDFFILFQEVKKLREENQAFKKQVSELIHQINLLEDYGLENKRLRNLLDYQEVQGEDLELLTARVIARDSSNWYDTIIINRGKNEGIKKDMPVVTHQGLVGRVINVSATASEILLLIDQQSAVGSRVWETRETPGVTEGKGDGSQQLSMIHMPHDAEIEIDQTIVTSGLAGLFPPGIRIGQVTHIEDEASGLMKRATIKPFVDFRSLEEVFVILEVNMTYQIKLELQELREGDLEQ